MLDRTAMLDLEIPTKARSTFEDIREAIQAFEADIDATTLEVGVSVNGLDTSFYVSDVRHSGSFLIVFSGVDRDDNPTRVVQHCDQVRFTLTALPIRRKDEARVKIGFHADLND